ncbi:hypothetical protein [Pseudodesulfovibrio thermohalotolerans]|uniref:hypothetical protein n=1 Tax=Pseudodesulfovibrio thermohalotolerans TaxID=2880651 RepID=UPI0038508900
MDALSGKHTLSELASKYGVHPQGWLWPMDGQHHYWAPVAFTETRKRLYAGTGNGKRSAAGLAPLAWAERAA